MGKVLIWFVIIIITVVLYCLMKVKAESDELYEELMRKHFDIVNIGLHFFLKDVRPMLPPVMNRSIVDA